MQYNSWYKIIFVSSNRLKSDLVTFGHTFQPIHGITTHNIHTPQLCKEKKCLREILAQVYVGQFSVDDIEGQPWLEVEACWSAREGGISALCGSPGRAPASAAPLHTPLEVVRAS